MGGNVIQSTSRTLWEEVRFGRESVTSVDWLTYPILDITEMPEKIDIVLINRPEEPPTGAGEPEAPNGSGNRQCHFRCDRRTHSARAILAGSREVGVVVG